MNPSRRLFLKSALALSGASAVAATRPRLKGFDIEEATIDDLGRQLASRKITAEALTRAYLDRIERLDQSGPRLRSVIETNPEALALARELDRERQSRGPRGPLHGIPILIKDNIDTADRMSTTAGSLALANTKPPEDAPLVRRLRAAGAVILGKTNLSEWANFRSSQSTSGWSSRGGLTRNPYSLDRNASGSSSGSAVAVAANLAAAAVGTETDGSIVSPSSVNGIVGVKPTVGLVNRRGIIPISRSQDTAGPMARTVRDAALLLNALAGPDPEDPDSIARLDGPAPDYAAGLNASGLRGARLGIVHNAWGFDRDQVIGNALEVLRREGAVLVDSLEIAHRGDMSEAEDLVLHYEFKAGIADYLARLGSTMPHRSLRDLIEFNERHRSTVMPYFGQETFLAADTKGPLTDPAYLTARANARRFSREEGIDALMDRHQLDALVAPTGGPAWLTDLIHGDRPTGSSSSFAAISGYPSVTVPGGWVSGLPSGISFFGRANSEAALLRLAYAFEQATRHRKPPRYLPPTGTGLPGR
ncbi:MAG: amidase [Verrucomicrobiales bacterium]|nr:amidase [Verrucomicrobiales bacterium]